MPRNLVILLTAALVAGLVAAGVAVANPSVHPGRGQHEHQTTLRFGIRFSPFFLLDLGTPGLSKGDQILSNDHLLNRTGKKVGHDGLACTITDPSRPEATCQGTFVLPGGQVTVQFLNSPPPVKVGAITGGTGRFRAARGEMKLVEPARGNVGSVTFAMRD